MNYRTISPDELKDILEKHKTWLSDPSKGAKANLRSADLRSADLSSADLRSADLSSADLRYADLSYADLRSADLSYADLSSANLRSADLLIFKFQRHTVYYTFDGYLRIGCHALPITEWSLRYEEIGRKEGYTDKQTKLYGDFIKMCLRHFNGAEK